MSAHHPSTDNSILWHHEPEQTGTQPKALLRAWLTEGGLLTARLRRLCDSDFRLEVLDADANAEQPGNADIHRRVILHCGAEPCIYAETVIPSATAERHPWLHELGDEPLGERLQSQPGVTRSDFRYARFAPDTLPFGLGSNSNDSLWARQSDFHISDAGLTVTEFFLTGIADNENRRIKLAD